MAEPSPRSRFGWLCKSCKEVGSSRNIRQNNRGNIILAEEDYAIIFSSTFDLMPHKNLNGWGFIPFEDALRLSKSSCVICLSTS
jgi:hypothetical protein